MLYHSFVIYNLFGEYLNLHTSHRLQYHIQWFYFTGTHLYCV